MGTPLPFGLALESQGVAYLRAEEEAEGFVACFEIHTWGLDCARSLLTRPLFFPEQKQEEKRTDSGKKEKKNLEKF